MLLYALTTSYHMLYFLLMLYTLHSTVAALRLYTVLYYLDALCCYCSTLLYIHAFLCLLYTLMLYTAAVYTLLYTMLCRSSLLNANGLHCLALLLTLNALCALLYNVLYCAALLFDCTTAAIHY
jgi:hypothetical protein